VPELSEPMLRKPHFWIALIVIAAVLFVLIAPSVDLDPTALRAWQAACSILMALTTLCRIASANPPRVKLNSILAPVPVRFPGGTGTAELNSILLC
jgi:hypothetical protein